MDALNVFLTDWQDDPQGNKKAFLALHHHLNAMADVQLSFIARPGISYSLRAKHAAQQKRELFVMVDVIEDDPRWLSVCFYQDLLTDPEGAGDSVPGGLLGEDAICFDMETASTDQLNYICQRMDEACHQAMQE